MPDEIVDVPVEGAPGGEPVTDPFEDVKVESFDRPYVEKIRREAAEHRVKAKSYEDAFQGWTPQDRQVWLETVQAAAKDPVNGAERLREIANALSPAQKVALEEETGKGLGKEPVPEYLTSEQLDERLKHERLEAETATQLTLIKKEAEGLGYTVGDESYFRLMWLANNVTSGDLAKADAHIKAERQKVIDDFVQEKRSQAENGTHITSGSGGKQENPIKTFKDANEAATARIRAARGEGF